MEPHGDKASQIGPKVVVHLDKDFSSCPETPPPKDLEDEEYIAEESFWESVLGVHPKYWNEDVDDVSESFRALVDEALKNSDTYQKDMEDYYDRIDELNAFKPEFSYVFIRPRYPSPRCFHLWHREFRMSNTNPTFGNKRFTEPREYEYVSSDLLQFFSMRFAGDFSHGEKMSIYGFVAVRDKIDCLRNYIFYRSSDHAQEITPDARDLLLIPPARGISATYRIIVEYCLKVKSNCSDACEEDGMLMDGCFEFNQSRMAPKVQMHKVRLFGPLGPLDTRFALFRFAVEATIDVKVKRAMAGYSLSMVTACTCGFLEEIVLYNASTPSLLADRRKDGRLSSSVMAVASAVMAVELGCELKLTFEISSEELGCGLGRHVRKSTHELRFTAQKHKSSKGLIVMGRMFKLAAKVTWSTMGSKYSPFFHTDTHLLGHQDGPCSF